MAHCTAGPIRTHWSSHNQVLQLLSSVVQYSNNNRVVQSPLFSAEIGSFYNDDTRSRRRRVATFNDVCRTSDPNERRETTMPSTNGVASIEALELEHFL